MLSGSKTWPPWLTSQTAGGMFHGAPPPQAALIPAFTTPGYTGTCCSSGLANSWKNKCLAGKITPPPSSHLQYPMGTDLEQPLEKLQLNQ